MFVLLQFCSSLSWLSVCLSVSVVLLVQLGCLERLRRKWGGLVALESALREAVDDDD